jgi:hypothetical protein
LTKIGDGYIMLEAIRIASKEINGTRIIVLILKLVPRTAHWMVYPQMIGLTHMESTKFPMESA